MIELRKVTLVRNGRTLLFPVSFRLPSGVLAAVTGPNGSGKTTLLKILAGLWKPTDGEILFHGKKPQPAHRREIGLVLQDSMLYGRLTVEENLRFFGRLYRVPDLTGKIHALARELDFFRRLGDLVSTLSKGYTQRVALARALLPSPSLLLLDEPFDGLDPSMRELVHHVLASRVAGGATAIVVTHDLDYAEAADVHLQVRRGRVSVWAGAVNAPPENPESGDPFTTP
ncbi:MAG: ABC transporter ATP-binding protein [Alicyclobacillaceae bacterium]|nr:ABC transporter ATP-binding protein [Alicyclobacillaceae bacterium]